MSSLEKNFSSPAARVVRFDPELRKEMSWRNVSGVTFSVLPGRSSCFRYSFEPEDLFNTPLRSVFPFGGSHHG